MEIFRQHSCACSCFYGGFANKYPNNMISDCVEPFAPNWESKCINIVPAPPPTPATEWTGRIRQELIDTAASINGTFFCMAHKPDSEAPIYIMFTAPHQIHARNGRWVQYIPHSVTTCFPHILCMFFFFFFFPFFFSNMCMY